MKNSNGVTLIELMIAMVIIVIVSLGFLVWETDLFRHDAAMERNNTAYAFALDVAERLQRMPDNSLIQHTTNRKCVGFEASTGNLKGCLNCTGGGPTVDISVGATGTITYVNPWNGSLLYLYDGNNCQNKTWTDAGCGPAVTISPAANSNIDHPSAVGAAYNSINPVRSYRGTTYYAVWSVAYMPCNAGTATDNRKIFITVYWLTPEPAETGVSAVQTKIANGAYAVHSVTTTVEKAIGTES